MGNSKVQFLIRGFHIKKIFVLAVTFLVIGSCKKEDNPGLIIQDHDSNKMMSFLHEMMKNMDSLTLSNDPDNDFAMMMKVHHNGGNAMARYELNEGSDSTLQLLAGEMIEKHQQDLITIDSFLVAHSPAVNESGFREQAEKSMEIMSSNADLQIINGKADHDFAILMIQHHEGAADLSDLELYYGLSEPLKRLALKIKVEQQKDIQKMQDWLLR